MTRFYTAFTLILSVGLALLMFGAAALGRSQYGNIIAHFTVDASHSLTMIHLYDVSRDVDLRLPIESLRFASQPISRPTGDVTGSMRFGSQMVVSPTGKMVIRLCDMSYLCGLFIWDDETFYQLIETRTEPLGDMAWSSDGRLAFQICLGDSCDVYVWDGTTTHLLTGAESIVDSRYLVWSVDGRLAFVAYEVGAAHVMVWDEQTVFSLGANDPFTHIFSLPAWSPDGRLAYSACQGMNVCDLMLWDGNTLINLTNDMTLDQTSPAWHSDGRLAFRSCSLDNSLCDLMLWDGVQFINVTNNRALSIGDPLWSASGQIAFIASSGIPHGVQVWDGQAVQTLAWSENDHYGIHSWSPDGQLLFQQWDNITGSTSLLLWDGQAVTTLFENVRTINDSPIWNPSGHLLFTACIDTCQMIHWDGQTTHRVNITSRRTTFGTVLLP